MFALFILFPLLLGFYFPTEWCFRFPYNDRDGISGERKRERKIEREKERERETVLFFTFNIIISHTLPENFIEDSQFVQKI